MIIHNIRYMYSYLLNVFHHINCNFQRTKAKYTFLEDRSLDGKRVIRRGNSRKDRQNNHLKKKNNTHEMVKRKKKTDNGHQNTTRKTKNYFEHSNFLYTFFKCTMNE